jgi:hypothetical protein
MEDRSDLALIEGQAFLPGQYKTKAWFEGDVTWASHPDSNGRIIAAHFGTASDTVTGTTPKIHTFARKDAPAYHTMWVGRPVAGGTFEYDKGVNVVVPELKFQYENGQLFKLATHVLGSSTVGVATAPSPTNTIFIPTTGFFGHTWARAVIKNDLATTPAATTVTNFVSWTVTSSYNAEYIATQSLNPTYYSQGLWSLSFEAEFIVADWAAYNVTFFGSASPSANAAQSSNAVSGSFDVTLDHEPTDANKTLQIKIPYMQFSLSRPTPNADASGLTATMSGVLSQPASGEPITVIQNNAITPSYS